MKGIIDRFTNMIEVQFAVLKELAFFLFVTQIGTGSQLNRITPEGFLHTGTIIYVFTLCMNPFIQKKIGDISQQQRAGIFNGLKTGQEIIGRMMPVVTETLRQGADVKQIIRFEYNERRSQDSCLIHCNIQ